jgi:hypothetical protein
MIADSSLTVGKHNLAGKLWGRVPDNGGSCSGKPVSQSSARRPTACRNLQDGQSKKLRPARQPPYISNTQRLVKSESYEKDGPTRIQPYHQFIRVRAGSQPRTCGEQPLNVRKELTDCARNNPVT